MIADSANEFQNVLPKQVKDKRPKHSTCNRCPNSKDAEQPAYAA